MVSQRDELRSRRYALRAAATALVAASPAAGTTGPRRAAIGVGAAITVVSLTIAAGFGLFSDRPAAARSAGGSRASAAGSASGAAAGPSPGQSPSAATLPWQRATVLIVDSGTGARYVYRSGRLHQVANQTSADLILGTPAPTEARMSHQTLAGVPIGSVIGIQGAPGRPPASRAMLHGGWAVCSGPIAGGKPRSRIVTSASGDLSSSGFTGFGTGLSGGSGLGDWAIVGTTGGDDYLIRNHHRYRLTDPAAIFAGWKWGTVTPVPIAADVLDTLPTGAALSSAAHPPAPNRSPFTADLTLCVGLSPDGTPIHTGVDAKVASGVGDAHVVIGSGSGVLVRATSGSGQIYLLTDRGVRYPIADAASREALGYRFTSTVSVPAAVLNRIPRGPRLSRTAAGEIE